MSETIVGPLLASCLATSLTPGASPALLPAKVFSRIRKSPLSRFQQIETIPYLKRWKSHRNLFVHSVSEERERPITTGQIDDLLNRAEEEVQFRRPAPETAETSRPEALQIGFKRLW